MTTTQAQRLSHGDRVRIRGERWCVSRIHTYGDVGVAHVVGCGAANRATHATFLLPFERIDRVASASTPRLVGRPRWRRAVRAAMGAALPSWSALQAPRDAKLTLIPYQLEPVMALVRGEACRFLIADAVGLGKTIEAGLMIAETLRRRPEGRAIVVTPAALRHQWQEELRTRFGLEADIFDAARLGLMAATLSPDVNPWAARPLVVTSIDYVKRPEVMRSLEGLIWDVVVLDEAHHLVGRSDRAAAAAMLSDRGRALVLLTATPHSGDDAAFARLSELGRAGGSEPLMTFRRTRADAGLAMTRRTSLLRVRPTPAEQAMHDALMAYARLVWRQATSSRFAGARLAVSVLMRRACSSAGSLARSVARRLVLLTDAPVPAEQFALPLADPTDCDDEPEDLLRSPGLPDAADERRHLEHVLQLAQEAAADESKMRALRRFVARANEPAIVFTEYRDTLQRLALGLSGFKVTELHGGLTQSERAAAVRRFTDGDTQLLLATDAGSEGLNLHRRCRLVVHLELPWTPLRLEQRAGRVDRIGQERRPHAVHLVAADTCEQSTLARLVVRLARMRGALNALTRFPDEQQLAESIFGSRSGADLVDESPRMAPGLVIHDMRAAASDEARRIARAREMTVGRDRASEAERPVLACVRQRRRSGRLRCLWAFKVELVTAAGRVVWEAILPIASEGGPIRPCSRTLLRTVLNPDAPPLRAVVDAGCARLVDALTSSMHPAIKRWADRECDLMAVLRARHARLSAGLLQRGLFDRRDERLAATQASILEEALAGSAERLRDLAQCRHPRVDASALTFAAVFQ